MTMLLIPLKQAQPMMYPIIGIKMSIYFIWREINTCSVIAKLVIIRNDLFIRFHPFFVNIRNVLKLCLFSRLIGNVAK